MKDNALIQMELTMKSQIRNGRGRRRERLSRASWWFNKMREVVDLAIPPQPAGRARPQQAWLGLRQTNLL